MLDSLTPKELNQKCLYSQMNDTDFKIQRLEDQMDKLKDQTNEKIEKLNGKMIAILSATISTLIAEIVNIYFHIH